MVVNLRQLHMGEEPCIHFVPTYTKTQQEPWHGGFLDLFSLQSRMMGRGSILLYFADIHEHIRSKQF